MSLNNIREDYNKDSEFSKSEVGLTHMGTDSFIRLCDNGNIEIFAGQEAAIILNPNTGTVTINADCIKFKTRERGGLRWNKMLFNAKATGFSEPTFITIEDGIDTKNRYRGVNYFASDIESSEFKGFTVVDDETGTPMTLGEYAKRLREEIVSNSEEETPLIDPNSLRET